MFIKIDPVNRDTMININSQVKKLSVSMLHIISNLDDTCRIMEHIIPPKAIDTILYSDQYNSLLNIKYEAYKAKRGEIIIGYKLN